MPNPTYLIVGLGNPGSKYAHTRHNVGFDVLSILADRLHTPVTKNKCKALVGEAQVEGCKVVLAAPQTYMNLSGEAVQALMHWYHVEPTHLLVIYDDIDLAPGFLRIRREGSAGTHNGMRSIINMISAQQFPRIRVGVGECPPGFDLADWVLSHYRTPDERQTAFDAYHRAADAAIEFIKSGIDSTMQKYNPAKVKPPKPPRPPKPASNVQANTEAPTPADKGGQALE